MFEIIEARLQTYKRHFERYRADVGMYRSNIGIYIIEFKVCIGHLERYDFESETYIIHVQSCSTHFRIYGTRVGKMQRPVSSV